MFGNHFFNNCGYVLYSETDLSTTEACDSNSDTVGFSEYFNLSTFLLLAFDVFFHIGQENIIAHLKQCFRIVSPWPTNVLWLNFFGSPNCLEDRLGYMNQRLNNLLATIGGGESTAAQQPL